MLGDFGADNIYSPDCKSLNSIRFNIEQSISNSAYIHYLTLLFFYKLGYCSRPVPSLVKKEISDWKTDLTID